MSDTNDPQVSSTEMLDMIFRLVAVTISLAQTVEALAAGDMEDARRVSSRISDEIGGLVDEVAAVADRVAVAQR